MTENQQSAENGRVRLRPLVMKSGIQLGGRKLLGMVIGVGGLLLLTSTIGAASFGSYSAALGLNSYLFLLGQWGLPVYLIRRSGDLRQNDSDQALTLLLISGSIVLIGVLPILGKIASWVRIDGFQQIAIVMVVAVPVQLAGLVPISWLERKIEYGRIAIIELIGQTVFYVVSVSLGIKGLGVWAPVWGWWSQQILVLILAYGAAGIRPGLSWNTQDIRPMLAYGFSYSASIWVWQLKTLVNPLIVSRILGAEVVGYIALATRISLAFGFMKSVTWRLSISSFSRIQSDLGKLKRSISDGMLIQAFLVGFPLAIAAILGDLIFDRFFDDQWLNALNIYPFIAFGYLVNSMFNLQSSALYVLKKNWQVTVFHIVYVSIFIATSIMLLPRFGILAYGAAEILSIFSYFVVFVAVRNVIGRVSYRSPLLCCISIGSSLFLPLIGWFPVIGLAAPAFSADVRTRLRSSYEELRDSMNA